MALLACARAILHDKVNREPPQIHAQETGVAVYSQPTTGAAAEQASFTAILNMAPYRGWSSVNFCQLREYIEGTWTKHKSHLWAMREDPSYFADTVNEYLNHNSVRVQSTCGCHERSYEAEPLYMTGIIKSIVKNLIRWYIDGTHSRSSLTNTRI